MLCMLTPKIVKSLRLWWTYALDPAHRRVARNVRVTAMYWVEGVCSSQPMIWAVASPTPLQQPWSLQIMVVLFGGNRNSGVFRWFQSNSEFLSYDQKEVPVKKFLRKKQESQGIRRNPGRNEKQSPGNGHSWNRKMQPRWVLTGSFLAQSSQVLLPSFGAYSPWLEFLR